MELIELIFKSRNIDPLLEVTVNTNPEEENGFTRTVERYSIAPQETLTGLKVVIEVEKLWFGTSAIAEEYTIISHKTARSLTRENFTTLIKQYI